MQLAVVKGRWRLIGIVQPLKQVTIDEQLLAQERDEIGEAPSERAPQLQVLHQQHGDQGGPDLRLDRIFGGADKGLDFESLLDRLEEQLNGPAFLVDGGDGGSCQLEVIGEEHQ